MAINNRHRKGGKSTPPKVTHEENKTVIEGGNDEPIVTILKGGLEAPTDIDFEPMQVLEERAQAKSKEAKKVLAATSVKDGKASKEARSANNAAFKASRAFYIGVFLGRPHNEIRPGDSPRLHSGFDDQQRASELETFWRMKPGDESGFTKRLKQFEEKRVPVLHAYFASILDDSPDCTIEQAMWLLLEKLIRAQKDLGHKYISLKDLGEIAEPFRWFAMRKNTDLDKTPMFAGFEALSSDVNSPAHGAIVGGNISISDTPEIREILNQIWEWYCSYNYSKLPFFLT